MPAFWRGACLVMLMSGGLPAASAQQTEQTCVEAQVGSERAYSCLSEALGRLAREAHSPLATNTLSATSPAPAVGTFNRTATSERMGNRFGHSVYSQRPAAPVFAVPLLRTPH